MKILFLFIWLLPFMVYSQDRLVDNYIDIGDTLYVFSINGLNARIDGTIESKVKFKLPYASYVVVKDKEYAYEIIDGRKGYWFLCESKLGSGYFFSGYLSEFMPPDFKNRLDGDFFGGILENWLIGNLLNASEIDFKREFRITPNRGGEKTVTENEIYINENGSIIMRNLGWEWSQFRLISHEIQLNDIINYYECFSNKYPDFLSKSSVKLNFPETKGRYFILNFREEISVVENYNTIEVVINLEY